MSSSLSPSNSDDQMSQQSSNVSLTNDRLTKANTDGQTRVGYEELLQLNQELQRRNKELSVSKLEGEKRLAILQKECAEKNDILESLGEIVLVLDKDFKITYLNNNAVQVFGGGGEELIGKDLNSEFVDGLGINHQQICFRASDEKKVVQYQTLFPCLKRWVDVNIYPKEDGGITIYLHDIHQHKTSEESHAKSEEKLRVAIEAAGLATWDWNLLTDEIEWNERHFEIFGLAPQNRMVHPSEFFRYVHPEDQPLVETNLNNAIKNGDIFEAEFRACLPDNTIRWMNGYGRVVERVNGEAVRMCGVMFDSTQLKLAAERLYESQARFQTIVNQATAGVAEIALDGHFTLVNQTFCQALGYDEDELIDMNWQDITHPDDIPHCQMLLEKAIGGGESFSIEKQFLRKDGTHIWMSESISSIRDAENKPQSAVAVLIDVTERKRAEEALRKSEEQYRAIIDQASVGILQCDLRGNIQVANDQVAKMLGYSTEELLRARVQDMTHEEDIPLAMEKFVRAVTDGIPLEVEKRCTRRDGSRLWVSASISQIRNEQGIPQAASIILVDITKRQEAEEKLRLAHSELERRVHERTIELAEALDHVREEIAQRKKAEAGRDKLLRRVVDAQEEERRRLSRELHDNMGQHLTAILLAVQALESKNQASGNQKSPLLATDLATDLARLRSMVDELLNVSHRLAWEIRPALLDNIGLKAALEQYVVTWSQKSGIEADFISRLSRDKTFLSAEAETALFRVAQEALTNVHRHSGAQQVSVVLEQNDSSIAVIVEDNGRGFDLENNDNSTRLGLMGMQERLELVGGTLTLESSKNSGATVFARVSIKNHGH